MNCAWCGEPIPAGKRRDSRFCSKLHRQASHRFGVKACGLAAADRVMTFGYADPPYPGKAHLYKEKTEVDHTELLARLVREHPDGFGLSTSAEALPFVLRLPTCPDDVRVGAWFRRTRHVPSAQAVNAWEPVILWRGRPLDTSVPQVLSDALIYKGRYDAFPGALVGMKPPEFSVWLFGQLGAREGDSLVDLYPGSGAVTEAWTRYTSPDVARDASRTPAGDASCASLRDAS